MYAKPSRNYTEAKRAIHKLDNENSFRNNKAIKNRIRTKIAKESRRRNR